MLFLNQMQSMKYLLKYFLFMVFICNLLFIPTFIHGDCPACGCNCYLDKLTFPYTNVDLGGYAAVNFTSNCCQDHCSFKGVTVSPQIPGMILKWYSPREGRDYYYISYNGTPTEAGVYDLKFTVKYEYYNQEGGHTPFGGGNPKHYHNCDATYMVTITVNPPSENVPTYATFRRVESTNGGFQVEIDPTTLRHKQCIRYDNIISFHAPDEKIPDNYLIYKDPHLKNRIAKIPNNGKKWQRLKDVNINPNKRYRYYIYAEYMDDFISAPVHAKHVCR